MVAAAVAIAAGIAGGWVAGAVVGSVGGVLFVVLIAFATPPDPLLYGVPIVVLWVALAASAGFAAASLRRSAERAREVAASAQAGMLRLHHAVEHLSVSATPAEVAEIAAIEGAAALGAEGAWVAVVDQRHLMLNRVASVGFDDELVQRFAALPLDSSHIFSAVARDGRARFYRSAEDLTDADPVNAAASAAVVALTAGGEPVGVIGFGFSEPRLFTDADRHLARTIADTVAQALERARLSRELITVAEALQRSLLPVQLPSFPGYEIAVRYRPASELLAIGGDWYDVVEAHRGAIGVAVGDVGGKGLEAAAIMGRLRTAMRAYALEHARPSEVLRRLVSYHQRSGLLDAFATVVYATLDQQSRQVHIASLGHPLPLLIRDDRAVPLAGRVAPPLSTPPSAAVAEDIRELTVPVQGGDLMIFFTDGVFERPDVALDAGLDRLATLAAAASHHPVEELADKLISAINDDLTARDDRALVLLRVPPP